MPTVRESEASLKQSVTAAVLAYQARLLAANTKLKLALATSKVSEGMFSDYQREFGESVVLLQNALSEVQVKFASDLSGLMATGTEQNTASATLPASESAGT